MEGPPLNVANLSWPTSSTQLLRRRVFARAFTHVHTHTHTLKWWANSTREKAKTPTVQSFSLSSAIHMMEL